MRKRLLDTPWPWIAAGAAIVVAFLSTVVELRFDADRDARPRGDIDDIRALRERDDVNVLFILIDTLRADRLGSYGYARETSPQLDRFAASGVRFDRHLAQSSWTKASMASLWTGLNPVRSGVTRFDDLIPEEAVMATEVFQDAGFRTAGIWRNGWVAPTFGFEQGFDAYTRPAPRPIPPQVRLENPTISVRGTDEDAAIDALEFLRIHGNERWFLYLHLMDLHEYLYDQQSALFGGTYSDIYDNSIRRLDGIIGDLLAHLANLDLLDETLVVIGSDHGEAFLERGHEGHARQVYPESTEVPLLLFFPFRLDPGIVVLTRSANVDVWPTVFDLLGLDPPADIDGRSRVPDLLAAARGETPPDANGTAFSHLDQTWGVDQKDPQPTVAVTEGALRYVRIPQNGTHVEQLFDASQDPEELRDWSGERPEDLARLRAAADALLSQSPSWGENPTREIGELELNQLRALGYAIP